MSRAKIGKTLAKVKVTGRGNFAKDQILKPILAA
jgi:hypothetical protein